MTAPDDHLADTNILLRYWRANDPSNATVKGAVDALKARGLHIFVAQQNLMEFWNTATRPLDRNGYGFTPRQADLELKNLEGQFPILSEPPEVYAEWRRLVVAHEVRGTKVHDAHLVAVMHVHELSRILTFNVRDFARYEDIVAVHPDEAVMQTL